MRCGVGSMAWRVTLPRRHRRDQQYVIVTVFLCLLVFVFVNLGPVRAVLLDVAPLAAPVADVLFI